MPLDSTAGLEAPISPERRLLDEGLSEALAALDSPERWVLIHKYLLGCSDEEAALALGGSVGSYRRLVRRALGLLRRRFSCVPGTYLHLRATPTRAD